VISKTCVDLVTRRVPRTSGGSGIKYWLLWVAVVPEQDLNLLSSFLSVHSPTCCTSTLPTSHRSGRPIAGPASLKHATTPSDRHARHPHPLSLCRRYFFARRGLLVRAIKPHSMLFPTYDDLVNPIVTSNSIHGR